MEITPRNCVENFWLSHVDRFLRSTVSQVEYCESRGLKRSSMNDWLAIFRKKYPEKFEKRQILMQKLKEQTLEEDNIFIDNSKSSMFVEVQSEAQKTQGVIKPPLSSYFISSEKLILETSFCRLYFYTYPEQEWLKEFILGLK